MVLDLRLIKVDCRETINFFCTYSNLCHTTLFSAIAHVAYVNCHTLPTQVHSAPPPCSGAALGRESINTYSLFHSNAVKQAISYQVGIACIVNAGVL